MSQHELGGVGVRQSPRFGINLFRGKFAPDILLPPEPATTPPEAPPPFAVPPRPPRPPRRFPITRSHIKNLAIAALLLTGFGVVVPRVWNQGTFTEHAQRGDSDYNQQDFGGAVTEYTEAIRLRPDSPLGYASRGIAYYQLDLYRRAIADQNQALSLTPLDDLKGRAEAYMYLGYDLDSAGDHKAAIADYDKAITLVPAIPDTPGDTADADDGTPDPYKGRMWAYYHDGQYKMALRDCNALISIDPYPRSLAVRAKIYAKMGNYSQVLSDLHTALLRDPRLKLALGMSIILRGQMHQFNEAASAARAASNAYPNDSDAAGDVGWWEYRAGQLPQAIASDKKALALGGSQPITLYNLGLTYAVCGNWKELKPAFGEALRISNNSQRHGAMVDVQSALLAHPYCLALRQALVLLRSAKLSAK